MSTTLLVSAPIDAKGFQSSFVSYRSFRSFQHLFGLDMQLRLFVEAARRAGCRPLYVPAPENFFAPQSYRRLFEVTGAEHGHAEDFIHVRFGTVQSQRVLKGMVNLAAIAEDPVVVPINFGRHPFACGDKLVAGMDGALVYDETQRPLARINGEPVSRTTLTDSFVLGDFASALPDPIVDDDDTRMGDEFTLPSGLHVQSVAEFEAANWSWESETRAHAPSIDFRRVLLDREVGLHAARRARTKIELVLVPWNLSHQGTIIPDVMSKIARFQSIEHVTCRPVLFPYNLTTTSGSQLASVVERLREVFGASKLTPSSVLIARLVNPRDVTTLAPLFPLAWIDGSDPERHWTMRRLAALGIRSAMLRLATDTRATDESHGVAFSVDADEPFKLEVRDGFGPRLFMTETLSARAVSRLVEQSVEVIKQKRPGASHALPPLRLTPPTEEFFNTLRSGPARTKVAVAA